eukprot:253776-Hanusia_phi.AAC.1
MKRPGPSRRSLNPSDRNDRIYTPSLGGFRPPAAARRCVPPGPYRMAGGTVIGPGSPAGPR